MNSRIRIRSNTKSFAGFSPAGQHYLFFIGDPKQAIYGFRGADVFTYLRAASEASLGFTLDTNFRSEKPLLDAINTLFTNVNHPFLVEGIEYRPVRPPQKSREGFAELVETNPDGPLRFRLLKSDDEPFNQTEAESLINRAVVADIARLKASGSQLANRPLKFGDMAVLVRSNAQASNLQNLLRMSGIKSVLKTEESVFKTDEACETLRLFEAVLEPGRDTLLKTALATSFVRPSRGRDSGLGFDRGDSGKDGSRNSSSTAAFGKTPALSPCSDMCLWIKRCASAWCNTQEANVS